MCDIKLCDVHYFQCCYFFEAGSLRTAKFRNILFISLWDINSRTINQSMFPVLVCWSKLENGLISLLFRTGPD